MKIEFIKSVVKWDTIKSVVKDIVMKRIRHPLSYTEKDISQNYKNYYNIDRCLIFLQVNESSIAVANVFMRTSALKHLLQRQVEAVYSINANRFKDTFVDNLITK